MMDPSGGSGGGGGDGAAERWLKLGAKLLSTRDFNGSKAFALKARDSDPNNPHIDHLLAVVDTLIAATNSPLPHPDWYSILQLPPLTRDPALISAHFRRLSLLLSPDRNPFPFAPFSLQLVHDAWSVLSDPTKKWLFDNDLAMTLNRPQIHSPDPPIRVEPIRVPTWQMRDPPPPPPSPPAQQQLPIWQLRDPPPAPPVPPFHDGNANKSINNDICDNSNISNDSNADENGNDGENDDFDVDGDDGDGDGDGESFWTACPYCMYIYEYEKEYEGCAIRCQNCRRGFHGLQVPNPPPVGKGKAKGEEGVFCCWGFFPLGFSIGGWKKRCQSNWVPFSPLGYVNGGNIGRSNPVPRVYVVDVSKKKRRLKRGGVGISRRGRPRKVDILNEVNLYSQEIVVGLVAAGVKNDVMSKNVALSSVVRKTRRSGKDMGRLDLNVEFHNNEGDEHAQGVNAVNGVEDGIENIGFFEGLDEFFRTLPILNVGGNEKAKPPS